MPRVSVIIPAHDAAAVIEQAAASVREQTYADWELIVADDASGDDTVARLRALDPRPEVVLAETNRGPAAARNLALARATGELVAFLDADDWWLPSYLERQVARYDDERARDGAPVGIVACNARIQGPDGEVPYTYYDQFDRIEPPTLERLLRRNFIFVSSLVPRAVGEEVGWFDEGLFGTEDHDLWIRVLERGYRAVVSREPLCVYRRTPGSISLNLARQAANNQKTYRRALDRGRLSPKLQRVARSELRYNRAMEAVAAAALGRGPVRHRLRALGRAVGPVAYVAATRPRQWGAWLTALRTARLLS